MRLTDMLKMPPYAKYMKYIVTNKRKIREAEISTMLANYTFKGGIPKKLGDTETYGTLSKETTSSPQY